MNEPKSLKIIMPTVKKPPPGPFLLEVTPEKLVVDPTKNLIVKIRNPTDTAVKVHSYFDSFFWLMEVVGTDLTKNLGDSKSMCFDTETLEPGGTRTLMIGDHGAEYAIPRDPMEHCDCEEDCWGACPIHIGLCVKVRVSYLSKNVYGSGWLLDCSGKKVSAPMFQDHQKAERGIFRLRQKQQRRYGPKDESEWNKRDSMKMMDLYLKDETEEYKKYREQFLEIRKDQERRSRWGHVLVNEKCRTYKRFRDLDGKIREFGDAEWERDVPTDLKQLDDLSDEEILKMRKERKERIEEYHRKLDEPVKKETKEEKKEEAVNEKSKVKTAEKSKRPEVPAQAPPKPNSMESKVASTETPSTNKKPVELPDKKNEQKKKKKTNPCCTIM